MNINFYGLYCEPNALEKCGHFVIIKYGSQTFLVFSYVWKSSLRDIAIYI
jgi:hypothetical protein